MDRKLTTAETWAFWLITGVLSVAIMWFSLAPGWKFECLAYEQRLVPIYAPGPKHHIRGPMTGYVDKKVCVKSEYVKEPDRRFIWPDPVY